MSHLKPESPTNLVALAAVLVAAVVLVVLGEHHPFVVVLPALAGLSPRRNE